MRDTGKNNPDQPSENCTERIHEQIIHIRNPPVEKLTKFNSTRKTKTDYRSSDQTLIFFPKQGQQKSKRHKHYHI